MKTAIAFVSMFIVAPLMAQTAIPPHLVDYVSKADDAFSWKLVSTSGDGGNTIANLKLTSQKWQGEVWEHDVQIFLPKGVKPTATVLLFNTGGSANPGMAAFGLAIAEKAQAPVVILYNIPKQPLYGKKEDALIAETFVKYLETKDPTWPLLFPMVKSVVKCMDAVQAFAKQEWKSEVTGFIITGASKRGWTTWLTAATGDPRVKAIAPMVFDSLNFPEQMPHQVKSFGTYSAMIVDYQARKLLPLPDTTEARQLWAMVDPWIYLEKITVPKLIINGTNDAYWTQDALNFYWKDLKGPKSVIYVQNAGHYLLQMDDPGAAKPKMELFQKKAVDALAAFTHCIVAAKPFPTLQATLSEPGPNQGKIAVTFDVPPKAVRMWSAASSTRDFRKQGWHSSPR